jgi:thiol:disulfide interchange protein
MPNRRLTGKRAAAKRKSLSNTHGAIGIAAVLAIAVAGVWYVLTQRPGSGLVEPVAAQTAPAAHPYTSKHIYDVAAKPDIDIANALDKAKREHKRVILDFGGDWCGDCQVLDIYFHQAPNADLLEKNFVLVHVWVGHFDANVDVAERYGVPLSKGVPALAVLSANGKTLYAQTGQFSDMRYMDPGSVTEFLNKWKG